MRQFMRLGGLEAIPDDTMIVNFGRRLERRPLAAALFKQINAHLARSKGVNLCDGSIVDATIISAPSSTKNGGG